MLIGEIMIMNVIPSFILVRVLAIQRVRRERRRRRGARELGVDVSRPNSGSQPPPIPFLHRCAAASHTFLSCVFEQIYSMVFVRPSPLSSLRELPVHGAGVAARALGGG